MTKLDLNEFFLYFSGSNENGLSSITLGNCLIKAKLKYFHLLVPFEIPI